MSETDPRLWLLIAGEQDAQGLRRVPVALVTRGFKGKQQYRVTAADLSSIVTNFRKRATGDLVVDYDHSTLNAGDGEPKPAAGWLKKIDDAPDADGVLWGWAEFTERAGQMIEAKEYKYVSPVIVWGARDKENGEQLGAILTSMAITNSPLFEKLPALPTLACMDAGWEFDRGDVVEAREEKKVAIKRVLLAAIAAGQVRLVADDNSDAGTFAVEGLRVVTMADVKRGSEGRWDFATLPQGEGVLVASDVMRAMKVQEALDKAVAEKKITPAQRPQYEVMATADLGAFETLAASMKPAVDTSERGLSGGNGDDTLEAVDGRIETLVKEKLAASDGKLDYAGAVNAVFGEHPELKTRRARLMR